jgi:hypothetical protein
MKDLQKEEGTKGGVEVLKEGRMTMEGEMKTMEERK